MDTSQPTSLPDSEKNVLKWQYRVVFATMLLFIPLLYLSHLVFHTLKYGLLAVCVSGFYLAGSSIKSRITIFIRWRGMDSIVKGLPDGNKAVLFGFLLIIFDIAWIIFIFTPFLSDKYLNF